MADVFKVRMMGGAFGLIAALSTAVWAETPTPADLAQEEAYLDVLPKVDVPEDIQPIPGAVNEEFRNCEAHWPAEYELSQKGSEARAYRDIYGYAQARHVVAKQDCTCIGKVASWTDVEILAATLRIEFKVQNLSRQHTKLLASQAASSTAVAETMCGGSF